MVERLFSQGKMIKTNQRKSMNPDNLDTLLFLKYNKCRWNINTVQAFLNEKKNLPPPSASNAAAAPPVPAPEASALTSQSTEVVLLQDENDEEED